MIWKIIRDENLGCNSCILGDEESAKGMVVDPIGAVGGIEYMPAAQKLVFSIDYVAETQVNLDRKSSAREIGAIDARMAMEMN